MTFNWGGIKPRRTPDKEVWSNPCINYLENIVPEIWSLYHYCMFPYSQNRNRNQEFSLNNMISIYFQWAPLQILRSSNRASFRVPSLPGYYLPGSKARKSTYRQSWLFKGDAIFFVSVLFGTMGWNLLWRSILIEETLCKNTCGWKEECSFGNDLAIRSIYLVSQNFSARDSYHDSISQIF